MGRRVTWKEEEVKEKGKDDMVKEIVNVEENGRIRSR